AIIMDGNGRWAQMRGWMDRIRGHEAGIDSVRAATENCAALGIQALTLYAFSKENWQRPKRETGALMLLLRKFLVDERPTLQKNNIRLIASGCLEDLPKASLDVLDATRELTAKNTGMVLNLALSYSAREEITQAARELAQLAVDNKITPESITPELLAKHLYTPQLPDPDLLIRTSGELRISNFLLWQLAYTEIHITSTLWPDFRRVHLLEALVDYQNRDRRFGKVKAE
ncbi:TPA: di-trans,poly-cis-decaprenylcistransferase, partial [Candidatus Sumerlaeota bacterium]|nr:di-trans,poly-cis-decaprenylcistransferase [Candidatus Sumerlaeota bacterium]